MSKADWTVEGVKARIEQLEAQSRQWQKMGNAKFAGLEWDEWLELDELKRWLKEKDEN